MILSKNEIIGYVEHLEETGKCDIPENNPGEVQDTLEEYGIKTNLILGNHIYPRLRYVSGNFDLEVK